jgi:ABC-type arginine transport system permease subunit
MAKLLGLSATVMPVVLRALPPILLHLAIFYGAVRSEISLRKNVAVPMWTTPPQTDCDAH